MKREIFTSNKPGRKNVRLLLALFAFLFSFQASAQLIGWNTASLNSTFGPQSWQPATLNTNLTMIAGLSRGASISTASTPANTSWGGSGGWGTTDATSVFFVFESNTGFEASLTTISGYLRRSGSGPTTCFLSYSLNGGAYTQIATWAASSTSSPGTANSTSLAGITELQNIPAGTDVRFRFTYPTSAGNWYITTGANGSLRIDGTVTAAPAPCTAPAALSAASLTATSADLSWGAVSGAAGYQYTVDQTATAPATAGTATTGTTFNATGLTPSTVYYLHVRTDCGGGNFSPWTTISFTTTVAPCIAPTGLTAANTTATTSDLSWNAQGGNSFEYTVDQTATAPATAGTATTGTTFNATGLTPSTVYYLHVRTDCGGGNFSPWTTISFTTTVAPCIAPTGLTAANTTATTSDLSWNAQGGNSFEYVVDQTATAPATAGTATTGTTFNATGLTPSTVYYLHVRTDCGGGNFSPWTTSSFTTTVAPCIAPTGLTAANTTATTSDLSWNAQGGNSFEYVVDQTATAPATAGTATTGTTFNATGLTPSTVYYLHVRTDCGGGNFSPWTTISFTTTVAPCIAPTGLTAANTTATTSDLSWNAQGGNSFEYTVDQTSTAPATAGTATTGTTFNATGLTPSTVYYLHVRTDCGGGNFSPWTTISFTTTVAPCIAPTGLTAANTTATTSDLSWNAQGGNSFEYVVDQTATAPATAGTATTGTTFNATGLTPSTVYYLHVRTDCGGGNFSPWTTSSFTTTVAPCIAPTGLTAANTTATTSDLSWNAQGGNSFEYVVDQTATAPATAGTATTGTTFNATGLTPSTVYYLHVRTDCGGGNFSPWTTISFTTTVAPCIAPTGLTAANTTATTSDLSWNAQGGNSFEYTVDQTATAPATAGTATTGTTFNATGLTPSTVYYLHVRTDCGGGNFSPWTTISFTTTVAPCIAPTGLTAANTTATTSDLSWNAQGGNSFEYVVDQTATAPATAGTATTGTTFNATGLTPSTVYYLHVRTDCGGGNFSPWTTSSFTTTVAPCIAPTGLTAANTTATTSDLSWNAQGGNSFEYVVDQTATAPATAGTATTGTTFNATGLTPSTVYYLHVRTDCGGGNFSPWTTISFTTGQEVIPCIAPSGVSALNITGNSADLTWNTQSGITGFEYVFDQTAGDPSGAATGTPNNAFAANGLAASTTYFFHVRTDCGNGNFSEWTTISFTTLSTVGLENPESVSFGAYPNPATGEVFISGQLQGTVHLTNLKGQRLMSIDLGKTNVLDVSEFETGMYFLIYSNGDATAMVKIIKH